MLELSWFIDRSRNTAPEGREAGSGPLSWLLLRLPVTSAGGSTSAPVRALVLSDKYRIGEAPRLAGSEPAGEVEGGGQERCASPGSSECAERMAWPSMAAAAAAWGGPAGQQGRRAPAAAPAPLHHLQPTCQAAVEGVKDDQL
jgi:hypothetical protein